MGTLMTLLSIFNLFTLVDQNGIYVHSVSLDANILAVFPKTCHIYLTGNACSINYKWSIIKLCIMSPTLPLDLSTFVLCSFTKNFLKFPQPSFCSCGLFLSHNSCIHTYLLTYKF